MIFVDDGELTSATVDKLVSSDAIDYEMSYVRVDISGEDVCCG